MVFKWQDVGNSRVMKNHPESPQRNFHSKEGTRGTQDDKSNPRGGVSEILNFGSASHPQFTEKEVTKCYLRTICNRLEVIPK